MLLTVRAVLRGPMGWGWEGPKGWGLEGPKGWGWEGPTGWGWEGPKTQLQWSPGSTGGLVFERTTRQLLQEMEAGRAAGTAGGAHCCRSLVTILMRAAALPFSRR